MKTKYVNANIKSYKELLSRLIEGEEFYHGLIKVYYDENERYKGQPFRYDQFALMGCSDAYPEFCVKKEVEWYEDLPDHGVLCEIETDTLAGRESYISHAKWYSEHTGNVITGLGSAYPVNKVRPLTNKEIRQFLQEE